MSAEPDICLAGFRLWVEGYQYFAARNYWDANWLRVTVECVGQGSVVRFTDPCVSTHELSTWADECESLVRGERQTAALPTMESYLRATIRPNERPGERRTDPLASLIAQIELTPDGVSSFHDFRYEINPTDLARLLAQLRALLAKFPVRGERPTERHR